MYKLGIKLSFFIAFFLGLLLEIIFHPSAIFYEKVSLLCIRITSYAFIPFLLVSLIAGIGKLIESREWKKFSLHNILLIIGSNLALSLLGGIFVFLYAPSKIKITQQFQNTQTINSWSESISQFLPQNTLSLLFSPEINLLPLYIFLVALGITLYFSQKEGMLLREILESSARVLYKLNSFIINISCISFFFLSGFFIFRIKELFIYSSFLPLVTYLFVASFILIFAILPIVGRSLFSFKKTYYFLYCFKKTIIYSFLSGDRLSSLTFMLKESRESYLIPRYFSSIQVPLYTLFFRGGNAFVSVITFVTLMKSYSSLFIGLDQIFLISLAIFIISFILFDTRSIFLLGMTFLSAYYGGNMEQSYLNLIPIMGLLAGISALLDTVLTAYFLVGMSESLKAKSSYLA